MVAIPWKNLIEVVIIYGMELEFRDRGPESFKRGQKDVNVG